MIFSVYFQKPCNMFLLLAQWIHICVVWYKYNESQLCKICIYKKEKRICRRHIEEERVAYRNIRRIFDLYTRCLFYLFIFLMTCRETTKRRLSTAYSFISKTFPEQKKLNICEYILLHKKLMRTPRTHLFNIITRIDTVSVFDNFQSNFYQTLLRTLITEAWLRTSSLNDFGTSFFLSIKIISTSAVLAVSNGNIIGYFTYCSPSSNKLECCIMEIFISTQTKILNFHKMSIVIMEIYLF